MSDPAFVNITFQITPDMPSDMKSLILYCFTDYYTKYFPEQKPSEEEYWRLAYKYPEIKDLCRNDAYHNVDFQVCQINPPTSEEDWIGVSIISLPRFSDALDKFFALVGPYIESNVDTLGLMENDDWSNLTYYYYIDAEDGSIKKHLIECSGDDKVVARKPEKDIKAKEAIDEDRKIDENTKVLTTEQWDKIRDVLAFYADYRNTDGHSELKFKTNDCRPDEYVSIGTKARKLLVELSK